MSSWVPTRTAPSEPLCSPSTSYAAPVVFSCILRSGWRRKGILQRHNRTRDSTSCQASQALQSYHNTYKLIQQAGKKPGGSPQTGPEPGPDEGGAQDQQQGQQQGQQRPRRGQRSRSASEPTQQQQQQQQQQPTQPNASQPQPFASSPIEGLFQEHDRLSAVADQRLQQQSQPLLQPPSPALHRPQLPNAPQHPTSAAPGRLNDANVRPNAAQSLTDATAAAGDAAQTLMHHLPRHLTRNRPPPSALWQPPPASLRSRTALTVAIQRCPSYTRLHQLLVDNAAEYNAHHTCATLWRMMELHSAGLRPRESRLFKESCSTMLTILRRQQPDQLPPRAAVVAAYSLARLELPDRELLAGLAAGLEPQLMSLQPPGLATLLWSLARLSHQPPARWMESALAAAAGQLRGFRPRELAMLLWSLARLRYKAAPECMRRLLGAAEEQLGGFCGRSLATCVHSLALSQQHPGQGWLVGAMARAVQLGPGAFTPQGLSLFCWGLAKLGCAPTPGLLDLLHQHANNGLRLSHNHPNWSTSQQLLQQQQQQQLQQQQRSTSWQGLQGARQRPQQQQQQQQQQQPYGGWYGGLDISVLLYSFATWGTRPQPQLARRLLAALLTELPYLEPNELANCMWACAKLKLHPNHSWMNVFLDASYRLLPYFKPVDLSQCLWSLARLSSRPPAPWLSLAISRLQVTAPLFGPTEVANTLWALAKMGVRGEQGLPSEVLQLLFFATDRRLSSFKPMELSSMVWAFAAMRRLPDKEWTAEFLKASYHKLPAMNGWCLATIGWSLAELALPLPPAWIYSYVNAARTLMQAAPSPPPPPPSAAVTTAAAAAGLMVPSATAAPNGTAGQEDNGGGGGGLSALDLAQIITALRRINGGGGGLAKVDEYLAEAEERLRDLEARSGAYSRQQVRFFLSMSPRQVGLAAAEVADAAAAAPTAEVVEVGNVADGLVDGFEELVGSEVGGVRAPASAAAKAVGGAAALRPRDQQPQAGDDGTAAAEGRHDAWRGSPSGGWGTTRTDAPSAVRLEVGKVGVELASPSGPAVWRRAGVTSEQQRDSGSSGGGGSASSSIGNGASGNAVSPRAASGDGDDVTSTEEIKRWLLAAAV